MNSSLEPLLIADHTALDFINTSFGISNPVELFNNDLQVYQWLKKAGVDIGDKPALALEGKCALLSCALELRDIASALIIAKKNEEQIDIKKLNAFLENGSSYYQLEYNSGQHLVLKTHRRVASAKNLLTPVAEAIAELLVSANFALVRKCENPDCTLWFYDRTKSHQRRWCDMAICGNRMKAAAFRARLKNKTL